jgi:hypothetical protein
MFMILRRGLIGVLALTLVASGVLTRQCVASAASGTAVVANVAHDHAAHDHSAHSHAAHDHAAQDTSGKPPLDSPIGKTCGKNCGMCMLAGTVALDVPVLEVYAFDTATYVLRADLFVGRYVPIDPGIPKRTS